MSAHLPWARLFETAFSSADDSLVVVSNPDICAAWFAYQSTTGYARAAYAVDPFDPLISFGYRRDLYAAALYGKGDINNPMKDALRVISEHVRPDLVVMTSQNAYARSAFAELPILSIERAPLPRQGHPQRMSFDIGGHQTNSVLETRACDIKCLATSESETECLLGLVQGLQDKLRQDHRYGTALAEFEQIRRNGRIALLATQPPDWVTIDGAFQNSSVEQLLCAWEEQLPEGWVGVPTYHLGYRLNSLMEMALSRSRKRLHFLSPGISQGVTDMLLTLADGLVSVSSTASMTGLLFGKSVVANGRSPFNAWCPRQVRDLSSPNPLSSPEIASTLKFLTHRYSWLEGQLEADPDVLRAVAKAACDDPDGDWYFDTSDWSIDRAAAHFDL